MLKFLKFVIVKVFVDTLCDLSNSQVNFVVLYIGVFTPIYIQIG